MILATVYVGSHMFELIVDNASMENMSTDGFRITPGLYSLTDGRKLDLISYDAAVYAPYEQPVESQLPPEADLGAEYVLFRQRVTYLGNDLTFIGIEYFHGKNVIVVISGVSSPAHRGIMSIADAVEREKVGALLADSFLVRGIVNPIVLVPGPYMDVAEAAEYARDYVKALDDAKPYVAENKTGRHFPGWGLDNKKG